MVANSAGQQYEPPRVTPESPAGRMEQTTSRGKKHEEEEEEEEKKETPKPIKLSEFLFVPKSIKRNFYLLCNVSNYISRN
ncbi:hypothetical protein RUM43_012347 [Polyplax serrata]|uniref:Uncharacterized protein n=1 Tax=Polyplax serrata TaxID=468196 RepID=A0AAN8NX37_POLSC